MICLLGLVKITGLQKRSHLKNFPAFYGLGDHGRATVKGSSPQFSTPALSVVLCSYSNVQNYDLRKDDFLNQEVHLKLCTVC